MKSSIFKHTISWLLAALLPAPLCAAAEDAKLVVERHPTDATFSKNATARFYVNAYSLNDGLLEYQWYRSQLFDTIMPKNDPAVKASPTPLSEGIYATLTTTTPSGFSGTKYCYYWVEITNHKEGNRTVLESEVAMAKIVDKTLAPQLMNGDFQDVATTSCFPGTKVIPPNNNSTTTMSYWESTQEGTPNRRASSTGKMLETGNFNEYVIGSSNSTRAAELSAFMSSTIYQDIATVPGKIYEWSIEHGARNNSSRPNFSQPDVIAVVIGSAINEQNDYTQMGVTDYWNKVSPSEFNNKNITTTTSNIFIDPFSFSYGDSPTSVAQPLINLGQIYPYGVNMYTHFNAIVSKVLTDNNIGEAVYNANGGANFNDVDRAYATTYGGRPYYVFISVAKRGNLNSGGQSYIRSGVYTVPAGQGTTAFGFVSVSSPIGPAHGNLVDNIVFASGSPIMPSPEMSYSNEAILTSGETKQGYAYGIAAVRGSSVSMAPAAVAYYDPDGSGPQAEVELKTEAGLGVDGSWYASYGAGTPFANGGVIRFKGLTPGKTYRIIGIPRMAVSNELGVNQSPPHVLDEGYYKDVKMRPAYVGSDSVVWNISVEAYTDAEGHTKARIGVQNARTDVEYALLGDSVADGAHVAATARAAHPGTAWQHGEYGEATFEGLSLDTLYHLVARPSGYEEVSYAEAAFDVDGATPVYISIRTPTLSVLDIDSSDVSRDSCTVIKVANVKPDYDYTVADPATGQMVGGFRKGAEAVDGVLRFSVPDAAKAYQIMARGGHVSWLEGVRAYGCPDSFRVDYVGEAVRSSSGLANGRIPVGVEFRIDGSDAAGTAVEEWTAGTDASPVLLSVKLLAGGTVSVLDSLASLGTDGTLRYRRRAGLEGYAGRWVSPVKVVAIPRRGAAPARPAEYALDYADETVAVHADSLQLAPGGTDNPAWVSIAKNSSWPFSAAGWGEGASPQAFSVRFPATGASFASNIFTDALPARPAEPSYLTLGENGGGGGTVTKVVIRNMAAGVKYEYRTDPSAGWTTVPQGSTGGESGFIDFAGLHICYLRTAATADSAASLAAPLTIDPLRLMPVYFPTYTYGSAVGEKSISIKNRMTASITVDTLMLVGDSIGCYALVNTGGSKEIPVSTGVSALWTLTPNSNLNAGTYNVSLVLKYRYNGASYETTTGVYLTVGKATWILGAIGEFDLTQTEARKLVLNVSNAPAGATLEYYFGTMPVDGSKSVVSDAGQSQVTFTAADGLQPGMTYFVAARARADNNHLGSTLTMLAAGYTAYATPTFEEMVKVNCVYERLDPSAGSLAGYTLGFASRGGSVIAHPSSDFSLSTMLDSAGVDSVQFFIVHNASGSYPASDTGYSAVIAGRHAAPTVEVGTVAHALSATSADGVIRIAGSFEYRIHGTSQWNPATDSTTGRGVSDYDVRYRVRTEAGSEAFASRTAMATVSTVSRQPSPCRTSEGRISDTLLVEIPHTANAVTYRWYLSLTDSAGGGASIANATGSRYAIPTDLTAGVYYFYCEVTLGGVSRLLSAAAQVMVMREIAIDTAFVTQKIYDGLTGAAVDSVRFTPLVAGYPVIPADYTATARFASPNVGGSDTVWLNVWLNDPNGIYILTNGAEFPLRGQNMEKTPADSYYLAYTTDSSVVYDGLPHGIPTPTPKNGYTGMGAITVMYNGSATLPDSAGVYAVTVDIADGTNFTAASGVEVGKFTIHKIEPAAAHLHFSPDSSVFYDGEAHGIYPPTLRKPFTGMGAITVKYNGSETLPDSVGVYAITADIAADTNFTAASDLALGKFTIEKAEPAAAHLHFSSDSSVLYDGLPHGVTAPKLKDGYTGMGAITVLYNGSTELPDSAGVYTITVDIAAGTSFRAISGLALGTFTIRKAPLTADKLTFTPASYAYDGAVKSVTVAPISPFTGMGSVTVRYNGDDAKPVNAGKYGVSVAVDGSGNFEATANDIALDTLVITKATLTADKLTFAPALDVYDGAAKSVTVTLISPLTGLGSVTVAYNGTPGGVDFPKSAGKYGISVTVGEGGNFEAAGSDIALDTFAITQAPLTVMPVSGQTKAYGDNEPTLAYATDGWKGSDGESLLTGALGRAAGDSVGSYAITQGDLSETSGNYAIRFVGTVAFAIAKAPLTVTPNGGQTKVYGDNDPMLTFTTAGWKYDDRSDSALIITGALGRDAGESVGSYAITQGSLSEASGNYSISFAGTVRFTITKAILTADMLMFTPPYAIYDNTAKSVTVSLKGSPADVGNVTVKYNGDTAAPANAGGYGISVSVGAGSNFEPTASDLTLDTFYIKYLVTFESNGGSAVESQPVLAGDVVLCPADPLKPPRKLGGWYSDAELQTLWSFADRVTRNMTLYASWVNAEDVVINGEWWPAESDSLIRYVVPCGDAILAYASTLIATPDTMRLPADFPLNLDTAITLGKRYALHLTRAPALAAQLSGRLLMVTNNPSNNGGLKFYAAEWYRKVEENGETYSVPISNNRFYYDSPDGTPFRDTIYAVLWDSVQGRVESCPYIPGAPPVAADVAWVAVYPNPAACGSVVHLTEGILAGATLEERYATFRLIDIHGRPVRTGSATELRQGLAMP
ncbi:MAG: MBG domain-containing protein, partial [Prevotellaceae bacterium]|nr:MBG domain-containing protein [Prevotellaceae bacterium]